ncbi:MAG: 16S rRNA (adenine(1518)-N(6)/adenine(1519)-N(6))-dimethyltransferase RsmA [Candidatus Acidiferrales bacterium]
MGQHFLADASWQQRILATLPRGSHDVWVEIGPGHGEMTRLLAAPHRRLLAIEADLRLAAALSERVRASPAEWPGVEVIAGDVLHSDLAALAGAPFRVYGNLPYYITSPILRRLFDCAVEILSIHIVIQWEVAERIVALPGSRAYGYLSALCQFHAKPEIVLRLPPGAFRPPPRVTSALVRITLPGERASLPVANSDANRFLEFVGSCFSQKRKTLRNNLREIASDDRIHQALAACGLRPDARAEQITLTQFATVFAKLF